MRIMKKNNKGFSLVELIIVIAIMAVLIGIMAPQLIKYIEKSNVVADQQLLDSIYQAVIYAASDVDVLSDPDSKAIIASYTAAPITLESIMSPAGNRLCEEVLSTLGWDDVNQSTYESFLKSAHQPNCEIYFGYKGGVHNPLAMWITTTDCTGRKDTSNTSSTIAGIGNCISIK